nr:MAG TPA: hypothetical protein [Caudoviricetes sp.]
MPSLRIEGFCAPPNCRCHPSFFNSLSRSSLILSSRVIFSAPVTPVPDNG